MTRRSLFCTSSTSGGPTARMRHAWWARARRSARRLRMELCCQRRSDPRRRRDRCRAAVTGRVAVTERRRDRCQPLPSDAATHLSVKHQHYVACPLRSLTTRRGAPIVGRCSRRTRPSRRCTRSSSTYMASGGWPTVRASTAHSYWWRTREARSSAACCPTAAPYLSCVARWLSCPLARTS